MDKQEMLAEFWLEDLKQINHFEYLDVDDVIILTPFERYERDFSTRNFCS
jgi:hypothetical protein